MLALHLISVAMIVGGALFVTASGVMAKKLPGWYWLTPVVGLLISGIWQFLDATGDGVTPRWHMIFGIKMLLALHILAIAGLMMRGTAPEAKMVRWMKGVAASGVVAIVLGSLLSALHRY